MKRLEKSIKTPEAPARRELTMPKNNRVLRTVLAAALTFGPLVKNYLGGNLIYAVMAGGVFMLLAAALAQWVDEKPVNEN